jgi:hypothetical protein
MPIALSLYFQSLYRDKVQKEFDKRNRVLSQKDIEGLLLEKDTDRILDIFRSAVVDHHDVDGWPYHLNYPINSMFYHDGLKRGLIADGIAGMADRLDGAAREDALSVLTALTDPAESPAGYVRVLAWSALGRMLASDAKHVRAYQDSVREALGGTVPSVVGGLLFMDSLLRTRERARVMSLLHEGMGSARYRVQKVLLNYFRHTRTGFTSPLRENNLETDIRKFLERLPRYGIFTRADVREGLRAIGMFSSLRKQEFAENTPHADIGARVSRVASEFLGAAGAFVRFQSSQSV